ncbi:glycosyltransferase [candidate division KSB1 bacterium]|nr:glycosyltransferase [candidate division KSB1 bacterium]
MKFCFITESWPDPNEQHICGSAVQVFYLAQRLKQRGHAIMVIVTAGKLPPQEACSPIEFIRATKHKHLSGRFNSKKNFKVIKAACDFKPDYVYQRGKLPETVIAQKIARQSKARFIWASNSDKSGERWKYSRCQLHKKSFKHFLGLVETLWADIRIQSAIKNAGLVLAQTTHQQKQLLKNYGIHAILFGSGHPIPSYAATKANQIPVVLWVANLTPIKRPLLFTKLAQQSTHLRAKFVMVGYPRENNLSDQIRQYDQKVANFEYLGGLSLDKINTLMNKADIFTMSSTHEGLANTFIQACLNALPTISLGHEPEKWISRQGLGVVALDFEEWKEAVHQFINDKDRRYKAGQNAYDFAVRHFDINTLADQLVQLLTNKPT